MLFLKEELTHYRVRHPNCTPSLLCSRGGWSLGAALCTSLENSAAPTPQIILHCCLMRYQNYVVLMQFLVPIHSIGHSWQDFGANFFAFTPVMTLNRALLFLVNKISPWIEPQILSRAPYCFQKHNNKLAHSKYKQKPVGNKKASNVI